MAPNRVWKLSDVIHPIETKDTGNPPTFVYNKANGVPGVHLAAASWEVVTRHLEQAARQGLGLVLSIVADIQAFTVI